MKRIYLLALSLVIFSNSLCGNYFNYFKKIAYGTVFFASGWSLLKGLQRMNNNWYYGQFPTPGQVVCAPKPDPLDDTRGTVVFGQAGRNNLSMNYDKCKNWPGGTDTSYLNLYYPRLVGPRIQSRVIVEAPDAPGDWATLKISKHSSWLSQPEFRQGLKLTGLGAAGLLACMYSYKKII